MTLFNYILSLSLSGSVLIGFVLILRLLFKNCPKIYSYALWLVVFVSLIVRITVPVHIEAPEMVPEENTGIISGNNFAQQDREYTDVFPSAESEIKKPDTASKIAFVWFGGAALLLSLYLKNIVNILGLLKFSEKGADGIHYNEYINSPFTFGILKPKIYLTYNLSVADKANIIAHEKVHIRRLDYIIKPLCFVITILHWFNPLVWLAFRLMSKDMELSCDEAVIRDFTAENKKNYCNTLLRFGVNNNRYKFSAVLFGEGDCSMRIKNVLNYKQPKKLTAFVLAVAVILTGCSAVETKEVYLPEAHNDETVVILADELKGEETAEETEAEEKGEAIRAYCYPTIEETRVTRGFAGQYPAHDGLDIAGPQGTEIYATADGTVITSEYSATGDGNRIIIDHGNSIKTIYAHCDELLVNVGDTVICGQHIATMGNTGNSTGNHLHFEAVLDGGSIDPYRLIGENICPQCGGRCSNGAYEQLSGWQEKEEVDCLNVPGEKAKLYQREYCRNINCPSCGHLFSEKGIDEKIICDHCMQDRRPLDGSGYHHDDSHHGYKGGGYKDGDGEGSGNRYNAQ